jgi:antitoxin component YwqK of YwqJK toxin-antitoxin module
MKKSTLNIFWTLFLLLNPFFLQAAKPYLTTMHIVDRNGISETISSPERLKQFQKNNFLESQPYQKIVRIYNRNKAGAIYAYLTTYHPNGQIQQYLEIVNSRAKGLYQEWHSNGQVKLSAFVVGGDPDITIEAQKSWLFDRYSVVYDEEGKMLAHINYAHGKLEGDSIHYYPKGNIKKRMPFKGNYLNGEAEVFSESGQLLQKISYQNDEMHGEALTFYKSSVLALKEMYKSSKLEEGEYFNPSGEKVSSIALGEGVRTVFDEKGHKESVEYKKGVPCGLIALYVNGIEKHTYHIKDDTLHGEEVYFFPSGKPELSVFWSEGKIHGITKSYYSNGVQESQREMSNNKKNGILSAWYKDGSLMLIEEYSEDRLTFGKYYKKEQNTPASKVENGQGKAIIHDKNGHFLYAMNYINGKPESAQ